MQPWKTIERVATPEGSLELRRRGERSVVITIAGRILMSSEAHRSESELAQLACAAMGDRLRPRVLVGGLGLGFTLRAALDALPPTAEVTVVDLNAAVVAWCKGPCAFLTNGAALDRRVKIVVDDVSRVIAGARADTFDAIILDLYEGPHHANRRALESLYGAAALKRMSDTLTQNGIVAIWSEEPDTGFESRFGVGFRVARHRGSRGGRSHIIYVGTRLTRYI
jgi:spermidine synthase